MRYRFVVYSALVAASVVSMAIFIGCGDRSSSSDDQPSAAQTSLIFPMFIDSNANAINDYFERETHDPGSPARLIARPDGGVNNGAALRMDDHGFIDSNDDGICDYAQDGSNTWHGPGFIDENGNGISDYWDENSSMHGMNGGMQHIDRNGNNINDYMEEQWHQGYGHDFTDRDNDGVCDYAQDGGVDMWHGPGFVDDDGDGMYDHWQDGGRGHGSMMNSQTGSMGPMM